MKRKITSLISITFQNKLGWPIDVQSNGCSGQIHYLSIIYMCKASTIHQQIMLIKQINVESKFTSKSNCRFGFVLNCCFEVNLTNTKLTFKISIEYDSLSGFALVTSLRALFVRATYYVRSETYQNLMKELKDKKNNKGNEKVDIGFKLSLDPNFMSSRFWSFDGAINIWFMVSERKPLYLREWIACMNLEEAL